MKNEQNKNGLTSAQRVIIAEAQKKDAQKPALRHQWSEYIDGYGDYHDGHGDYYDAGDDSYYDAYCEERDAATAERVRQFKRTLALVGKGTAGCLIEAALLGALYWLVVSNCSPGGVNMINFAAFEIGVIGAWQGFGIAAYKHPLGGLKSGAVLFDLIMHGAGTLKNKIVAMRNRNNIKTK